MRLAQGAFRTFEPGVQSALGAVPTRIDVRDAFQPEALPPPSAASMASTWESALPEPSGSANVHCAPFSVEAAAQPVGASAV